MPRCKFLWTDEFELTNANKGSFVPTLVPKHEKTRAVLKRLISNLIAALAISAPLVMQPQLASGSQANNAGSSNSGPSNSGLLLAAGGSARSSVSVTAQTPQSALKHWWDFQKEVGGTWRALWNANTRIPLRIFGTGIAVPGAIADSAIAELHARTTLAKHLTILAPGATSSDFVLVSNEVHRGIRSIGFKQFYLGMPVLGGPLSFRYKTDRLVVMGSEALPKVKTGAVSDSEKLPASKYQDIAAKWIREDGAQRTTHGAVSELLVLPVVAAVGAKYHTVVAVTIDSTAPIGKWQVYLDAKTGERVAKEQVLRFGSGTVEFLVPRRHPLGERAAFPAVDMDVTVDGSAQSTNSAGQLSWQGAAAVNVRSAVTGPLIDVSSVSGTPFSVDVSLADGGASVVESIADEAEEAQLSTFIHARIVKDYVRNINPNLAWLDTQLPVRVNIEDECNAFSDGNSINFFLSSGQCANTALLADVVYHEFGHSMHSNSIIEGVGASDGAFGEGLSDYLAATITGDPAMGVGFFKDESPLRHIDPLDKEHVWPDDIRAIHYTGLIFAGAMWDLRKIFVEKFGEEMGVEMSDRYYYGAVQRASNIPATYIEILLEDDDDGNLSNGTPNICDINSVFGLHGLRLVNIESGNLSVVGPEMDGYQVELKVLDLFPRCPGDSVSSATINWQLRADNTATDPVTMTQSGEIYTGVIPRAAEGDVVRYRLTVEFADGSKKTYPENQADPYYEFYIGEVVELFCTDFESDPFSNGWTHALAAGSGEGADDWSWGAPNSPRASFDPQAAFSGNSVVGNDLGGELRNGNYQSSVTNYLLSPTIEIGDYSDVRLQYRRWLNVEDGFFDQATIYSNNQPVWTNFNSDDDSQSTIHHTDREWRFHDVSLIGTPVAQQIQIMFELKSDQGLELGGWNIDDFCIVANQNSVCGDSQLYGPEECDEGGANSDTEPDACRTSCLAPSCGDGVVDSGETCDDGNTEDGDRCSNSCLLPGGSENTGDCGCSVGVERPWTKGNSLLLLLGFLGFWALRRQRHQQ